MAGTKKKDCMGDDFSGTLHAFFEDMMELYEDYTMPPPCPNKTDATNTTDVPNSTLDVINSTHGGYNLPQIYGNVHYALDAYEILVPFSFSVMCILIVVCFTVFFVQYKRVSPISNSVYAMLSSITLFNFMTIASSFAEQSYLYRKKSAIGMLPFEACEPLYHVEKLSQICHAVSIWLTAAMCVQKTICICKPFVANRIVSTNATIVLIAAAIVLGLGPFIVQFFDSTFHPYTIIVDGQPFMTCRRRLAGFITDAMQYLKVSSWLTVLMARLVPCFIILIMSILILVQLRKHNKVVRRMSENKSKASQKGATQKTRVAMLVFFVAVVVFSVEVSTSIVFILFIVQIYENVDILDTKATQRAAFGIDIVLYISYVVILMSYCITPRTLKNFKQRLSQIRLSSLQTESGILDRNRA